MIASSVVATPPSSFVTVTVTGYEPGATVAMPSTAQVRAPGSVAAPDVETTASDMPEGSPVATAVRAEPVDATSVAETVTWEASLYCTGGASLVMTGRWIANVRATEAGFQTPSPACEAVIVHDPRPVICTVVPETVHWPAAANTTGRAESDVALTLKSGASGARPASGAKSIVCWARGASAGVVVEARAVQARAR